MRKRNLIIFFIGTIVSFILALGELITRLEASILIILFISFIVSSIVFKDLKSLNNDKENESEEILSSTTKEILFMMIGLAGLPIGAELFTRGGVQMAQILGVSELMIGLTVIAFGTSLPELAASIIAIAKGNTDMSVGNIVGSNIFNTLGILGTVAAIKPIKVPGSMYSLDFPVMIFLTILTCIFAVKGLRRWHGGTLLFSGLVYLIMVIIRQ